MLDCWMNIYIYIYVFIDNKQPIRNGQTDKNLAGVLCAKIEARPSGVGRGCVVGVPNSIFIEGPNVQKLRG